MKKPIEIARRIGDIHGEGNALGNMGSAYAQLGEYRKAIELYEKAPGDSPADRRYSRRGQRTRQHGLWPMQNLASIGRLSNSMKNELEIARRIGDIRGEGNALGNMGLAYAKLGDKTTGRQHLLAAKKIFQDLGLDHMVQQVDQMLKYRG